MKRIDYDFNGKTIYSDEDQDGIIPRKNERVFLPEGNFFVASISHYPGTKYFNIADPVHIISIELMEV